MATLFARETTRNGWMDATSSSALLQPLAERKSPSDRRSTWSGFGKLTKSMKAAVAQLALVLAAVNARAGAAVSCSDAEQTSVADAFANFQSSISTDCSGGQCAEACVSTQRLLATALPNCEYVDGVNYQQKALDSVAGCEAGATSTTVTYAPATDPASSATGAPAAVTYAPADATYAPVDTTYAPVDVTYAPVDTTHAPVDGTYSPVGATFAPVDATYAPVDTTYAPIDTTYAPVDVTYAPVGATYAPIDATYAPVDTTYAPIDATYAPVDVTYAPGDATYAPVDTTYMPATVVPPSDTPTVVTDAPVMTEAPVSSTDPPASTATETPTTAPAAVTAGGSLGSPACSTEQGDVILETYAEYQANISMSCGTDSCNVDCVTVQSTVETLLPDCVYDDGTNYYEKVASELEACGISRHSSGSDYTPSTLPCSATQSNVTIILYRQNEAELKEACDADQCSTDCISIVNQLSSVLPDCVYPDGINYRNESISIIQSCDISSSGGSDASLADDSAASSSLSLAPIVVGVAAVFAAWL